MAGAEHAGFLIDTSAWIDAMRPDGDSRVRSEVRIAVSEGMAHFCDIVLLELWNRARGKAEMEFLSDLERDIQCVGTTPEVWLAAREISRACRKKGSTLPSTDLLIAACASFHRLSIIHNDQHFDLIARAQRNS